MYVIVSCDADNCAGCCGQPATVTAGAISGNWLSGRPSGFIRFELIRFENCRLDDWVSGTHKWLRWARFYIAPGSFKLTQQHTHWHTLTHADTHTLKEPLALGSFRWFLVLLYVCVCVSVSTAFLFFSLSDSSISRSQVKVIEETTWKTKKTQKKERKKERKRPTR